MNRYFAIGLAILASAPLQAKPAENPRQTAALETSDGWPEVYFEIFRLAPGRQEAFIRDIAVADEMLAAGGQPPIQMFIHDGGADWDVLLFKPEHKPGPTPAQQAAMDAKAKELGMETGPAYFINIRKNIASHSDTKAYGPLKAADWLARLDAWRASHPGK